MKQTDQDEALRNLLMENEEGSKKNRTEPSFHFFAHKAGMQKVDKEKVNAIIHDASKNSRFYGKQIEKKEKYDQSVSEKKVKIEKFRKDRQEVDRVSLIVQRKIEKIEKERDLSRTWVHIDLDMFFAACEIRDNPELKDKPVAVGGMMMIGTANYVARQYGVRSAMPGFIAKKLCPELIFISGNFQKYQETAGWFKNIVAEYDPDFESGGLDEALLDITDYLNEHGIHSSDDIEKLCYDMRMRINEATGITCSCGIAPNKMLAKLSTEINKPNGQYYMKPVKEEILTFLEKLPVRKIPGIGNSYEQVLNGLGINSCKDIINNLSDLYIAFTENAFDFFIYAAFGVSRSFHVTREARKSISCSRTFPTIHNQTDMENKIREIAILLSEELQYLKKKAKHFTLIIKTHNFDLKNKGVPIEKYIDDGVEINKIALKLFHELVPVDPLRLIGIRATQLLDNKNLQTLDTFFNKTSLDKSQFQNENTENTVTFSEMESDLDLENNLFRIPEKLHAENDHEFSENTTFSTIFQANQESNSINEQLSRPQNIIPEKPSGLVCPICNFKFESAVNKTRINNHIDKCLLGATTLESDMILTENSKTQNFKLKNKKEEPHYQDSQKTEDVRKAKTLTKKRSHEETTAELKKMKKSPIDTKGIKKIDDFFCKNKK